MAASFRIYLFSFSEKSFWWIFQIFYMYLFMKTSKVFEKLGNCDIIFEDLTNYTHSYLSRRSISSLIMNAVFKIREMPKNFWSLQAFAPKKFTISWAFFLFIRRPSRLSTCVVIYGCFISISLSLYAERHPFEKHEEREFCLFHGHKIRTRPLRKTFISQGSRLVRKYAR